MTTRKFGIMLALACAAFLHGAVLSGCALTHRTSSFEPSGYLGDYSNLKPGESDQAQLIYINDAADFTKYDKIQIRPVDLYDPKGTDLRRLSPADQERLTRMLGDALREELGKDYQLVDAPGPGVMTLKAAVTEARPSKPLRNAVSSILPIGLALSAVKRVLFGTHIAVGGAAIEAELDDSVTRERLFAGVARRAGRKWGAGNFSSWGDVDSAFRFWAQRMRLRLEQQTQQP